MEGRPGFSLLFFSTNLICGGKETLDPDVDMDMDMGMDTWWILPSTLTIIRREELIQACENWERTDEFCFVIFLSVFL